MKGTENIEQYIEPEIMELLNGIDGINIDFTSGIKIEHPAGEDLDKYSEFPGITKKLDSLEFSCEDYFNNLNFSEGGLAENHDFTELPIEIKYDISSLLVLFLKSNGIHDAELTNTDESFDVIKRQLGKLKLIRNFKSKIGSDELDEELLNDIINGKNYVFEEGDNYDENYETYLHSCYFVLKKLGPDFLRDNIGTISEKSEDILRLTFGGVVNGGYEAIGKNINLYESVNDELLKYMITNIDNKKTQGYREHVAENIFREYLSRNGVEIKNEELFDEIINDINSGYLIGNSSIDGSNIPYMFFTQVEMDNNKGTIGGAKMRFYLSNDNSENTFSKFMECIGEGSEYNEIVGILNNLGIEVDSSKADRLFNSKDSIKLIMDLDGASGEDEFIEIISESNVNLSDIRTNNDLINVIEILAENKGIDKQKIFNLIDYKIGYDIIQENAILKLQNMFEQNKGGLFEGLDQTEKNEINQLLIISLSNAKDNAIDKLEKIKEDGTKINNDYDLFKKILFDEFIYIFTNSIVESTNIDESNKKEILERITSNDSNEQLLQIISDIGNNEINNGLQQEILSSFSKEEINIIFEKTNNFIESINSEFERMGISYTGDKEVSKYILRTLFIRNIFDYKQENQGDPNYESIRNETVKEFEENINVYLYNSKKLYTKSEEPSSVLEASALMDAPIQKAALNTACEIYETPSLATVINDIKSASDQKTGKEFIRIIKGLDTEQGRKEAELYIQNNKNSISKDMIDKYNTILNIENEHIGTENKTENISTITYIGEGVINPYHDEKNSDRFPAIIEGDNLKDTNLKLINQLFSHNGFEGEITGNVDELYQSFGIDISKELSSDDLKIIENGIGIYLIEKIREYNNNDLPEKEKSILDKIEYNLIFNNSLGIKQFFQRYNQTIDARHSFGLYDIDGSGIKLSTLNNTGSKLDINNISEIYGRFQSEYYSLNK